MNIIKNKNVISESIIIALTILVIIFSGNILAMSFETYRKTTTNKILDNLFLEENTITYELLTNRRIYDISALYLKAVLHSAADFSYLPHDKGKAFFAIIESLPNGMIIDSFTYDNNNLSMICHTQNLNLGELFVSNLQDNDAFGGVVFSKQQQDNNFIYWISCVSSTDI